MAILQTYKPGQGTWTRGLTALGVGILVAFGIYWIDQEIQILKANEFVRGAVGAIILAIVFGITWWLLNKPRIVDFMIATESEMRKVNWPSQKEIRGSTIVVIVGVLLVTGFLFIIDFAFTNFFTWIKIIDIG